MKRFIPILIMIFYFGFHGQAQLVVLDDNIEVVTNESITINGTTNDITTSWKLHEARPNPARNYTWINYDVSLGVQNAQIVVRNLLGNIVHTENLSPGGERARINTSGLSKGIYIYSLVIDKQVVQSKRLVVAN